DQLFEELEAFGHDIRRQNCVAGNVSTRSGEACHKSSAHRIADGDRHDWNCRRRLLRRPTGRRTPRRDHVYREARQLRRGHSQTFWPIFSLSNRNGDIAAFDVAVRLQPAAKVVPNQRVVDDTNTPYPILWLRARSNGPRDRGSSESSDELTPPHL